MALPAQYTQYPPELDDNQLNELLSQVKDWQVSHGNCLKLVRAEEPHTVLARTLGISLFPSLFPSHLFRRACDLHAPFNRLYSAVAADPAFLNSVLKAIIDNDPVAATLWSIHESVKDEHGYVQDLAFAIFRSDYMLQASNNVLELHQVEFNTVAVAGAAHAQNVSAMHRHFARNGLYEACEPQPPIRPQDIPLNNVVESLVSAIAEAHDAYGSLTSDEAVAKAVLMVVQPDNVNICDERPIEYQLWSREPPVETYRVEFGEPLLSRCRLGLNKELLFRHGRKEVEVSVAYMRAGYETEEYDEAGIQARRLLAQSRAINCPTVLTHLTTFKIVQQALASSEILSRFLPQKDVDDIKATMMPMYVLDETETGQYAQSLATDTVQCENHILKPSLEGGGHNIVSTDIPSFLNNLPRHHWRMYLLMERIRPPSSTNMLITPRAPYHGETISELGVFSTCLWHHNIASNGESAANARTIERSTYAGWVSQGVEAIVYLHCSLRQ